MDVRATVEIFGVIKTQIANIIANKDDLYKIWNENGQSYKKQKRY